MEQGEIWWAELPEPRGSEPGYRRPVVVIQSDAFNRSRINTVLCVAITSNLRLTNAPGNAFLSSDISGLPRDSVINISQVITLDRQFLTERVSSLPQSLVEEIIDGIIMALGR